MSQLDLWLENPPKTFLFCAYNEFLFVAGHCLWAPLFMRIKSISLRLKILDLSQQCTVELTLGPTNKNIRMAALVDVALKCFSSVNVCRKKPGEAERSQQVYIYVY